MAAYNIMDKEHPVADLCCLSRLATSTGLCIWHAACSAVTCNAIRVSHDECICSSKAGKWPGWIAIVPWQYSNVIGASIAFMIVGGESIQVGCCMRHNHD